MFPSMLTQLEPNSLCVAPELAPPVAKPKTPRRLPVWFEAGFWVVAWFIALVTPMLLVGIYANLFGQNPTQLMLPAMFCGQLLALGLTVFILWKRVGRNWAQAIQLRRPALSHCLWAVLGLPAVILLSAGLTTLLSDLLGDTTGGLGEFLMPMTLLGFFVGLVVHAVGPAVGEELFFRGYLGRLFLGRYGVVLGVLFTSIVFGLIHGNLPQAVMGFIFGCYAHWAYLATRSLWVPILLHFLTNAFVRLLIFCVPFDVNIVWIAADMWFIAITIVIAGACAVGAAWGLVRLGRAQIKGA